MSEVVLDTAETEMAAKLLAETVALMRRHSDEEVALALKIGGFLTAVQEKREEHE